MQLQKLVFFFGGGTVYKNPSVVPLLKCWHFFLFFYCFWDNSLWMLIKSHNTMWKGGEGEKRTAKIIKTSLSRALWVNSSSRPRKLEYFGFDSTTPSQNIFLNWMRKPWLDSWDVNLQASHFLPRNKTLIPRQRVILKPLGMKKLFSGISEKK